MKTYNIPATIHAFLFDLDSTLYTHPEYAQFQLTAPVEKLARLRGQSFAETQQEIAQYRQDWAAHNQGQAISLSNIFVAFGISIEQSIRWREELYEPAQYLKPDLTLRSVLCRLNHSCRLAIVTNNPVLVAQKTIVALGVDDLFTAIVGLDTCMVSKPTPAPFLKAVSLLDVPAQHCVSVGDRYDIDLAVPLTLGMGAVLVEGVAEVNLLCEKVLYKGSKSNPML
jgi:phosphoglycolate phosphatase/putative hydrolase of the HAD superfamily